MMDWFEDIQRRLITNFIEQDRWNLVLNGFGVTLKVTFFSVLLGIAIGVLIAIIRSTHDKNRNEMRTGLGKTFLSVLNFICKTYLTVIRGTPVVVQLMFMFFVIFGSSNNKVLIAVLAFGINSGAYVAEIVRGGIMSIDEGQFEAGRSLGFNYVQTMRYIIIPQTFKVVLPSLANEFIVLLKETSIVGYVALQDLTRSVDIIRSRTYDAAITLTVLALLYLTMVLFFTWLVAKLERRLRDSER